MQAASAIHSTSLWPPASMTHLQVVYPRWPARTVFSEVLLVADQHVQAAGRPRGDQAEADLPPGSGGGSSRGRGAVRRRTPGTRARLNGLLLKGHTFKRGSLHGTYRFEQAVSDPRKVKLSCGPVDVMLAQSKYSSGLAMVVLQKPSEPFATANRRTFLRGCL